LIGSQCHTTRSDLKKGLGRKAGNMALFLWKVAFLVLLAFSIQCGVAVAFDVSFLQGCPEFNNVTKLFLNYSRLNGSIPSEIGRCTALETLDLYLNNVSFRIPPEIGQLHNLRVLNLSYNILEGAIPPEIGQLSSLESLNIGVNRLSGPIPKEIGNLLQLKELILGTLPKLSGPFPAELCQLSKLQKLELSSTNVTGRVPECPR
jgi:hypothetical protein